ncbi:TerD family protein [Kitasatospora sp. McL0602]|uniref:TerD family protein n=1 Tax=Kitasatospora sp. McL0602 TaxID=3439530 RepID=UPI003F892D0C
MTHVMAKGANISLTAAAVRAVLCWQVTPGSPEVDASALLLGPEGKVGSDIDFVFYNQPSHPSGLVRHQPGAHPAGSGEASDTVEVDLARLPAEVHRVVLAASAEGGAFPEVTGLRLVLRGTGIGAVAEDSTPIAEFDITDAGEVSALVAAELYRRDGGWKFRAVGQGYATGLIGLATDFGITVEDEDCPADRAPSATSEPTSERPPEPTPAPTPTVTYSDDEPDTYTLAPAPAMPATLPPLPPLPPPQPGYSFPYPQPAPAPTLTPALTPDHAPTAYAYPAAQPPTQPAPVPQPPTQLAPSPQALNPQAPPQQSTYGYGYPPPPVQPPYYSEQPTVVLPPQGPQFQNR